MRISTPWHFLGLVSFLLVVSVVAPAICKGQQNSNEVQILKDSEAIFPVAEDLVLRGFSNSRRIIQPSTVTHAVVMIHGILRNPERYYLPATEVLKQKGLFAKVALIAIAFDNQDSAPRNMPRLAYFGPHWKHGDFGGKKADDPQNRLSAFHAMDRVIEDLTKAYPRLKHIKVIGHSAGAQFVDRYSIFSSVAGNLQQVHVQFVAMAPSMVLYPAELRPIVDKDARLTFGIPSDIANGEYNEYPYGLGPATLLTQLVERFGSQRPKMVARVLQRDIVFAVGTEDTTSEWLDQSPSAKAQGPNRYMRLKYYAEFLKSHYYSKNHRFLPIFGVGHNSQKLIKSREMSKFFSDREG